MCLTDRVNTKSAVNVHQPEAMRPTGKEKILGSQSTALKSNGSATTALTHQQRQESMGGRKLEQKTMHHSGQEEEVQVIGYRWATEGRGFKPDIIHQEDLSFVQQGGVPFVAYPYKRNGVIYRYKLISCDGNKTIRWHPKEGEKPNFYREDCLLGYLNDTPDERPLVIVEGEPDATSVLQAMGDKVNVLSLPNGGITNTDLLLLNWSTLKRVKKIYLFLDDDDVGDVSADVIFWFFHEQSTSSMGKKPIKIQLFRVPLIEGCKDANDVLRLKSEGIEDFGEQKIRECIEQAQPMGIPDARVFSDKNFHWGEPTSFLETGTDFDEIIAMPTNDVVLLEGYNGQGKSQFATWYLWHMAINEDIKVGLLCLETQASRLRRDFFAYFFKGQVVQKPPIEGRKSKIRLKPGQRWATPEEIAEFEDFNDRHFRYITLHDDARTIIDPSWVREVIMSEICLQSCKAFLIDPFNQIEKQTKGFSNDDSWLNDTMRQIGRICSSRNVMIMIAVHPKTTDDESKIPMGHNIKGGNEFANRAGLGFSYWRDRADIEAGNGKAKLKIWKVRDRELWGIREREVDIDFDQHHRTYSIIEDVGGNTVVPYTDAKGTKEAWKKIR